MPNIFKSELHQLVLDRICHWWVLVHTSCPCDILQNQPTLEGLNLSSAWVQPFSKEQHFPVEKQAAGTLPTACLSEKGILSLLSPGVVSEPHHWHCPACLGCRGVLTALGTHCCLVTALESHWMTFCIPSLSFFLPCSPLGSYKSTRVLLNLIFHTEGFYPLLCIDLDMHHPEMKQRKERGANTLLSPWRLLTKIPEVFPTKLNFVQNG